MRTKFKKKYISCDSKTIIKNVNENGSQYPIKVICLAHVITMGQGFYMSVFPSHK